MKAGATSRYEITRALCLLLLLTLVQPVHSADLPAGAVVWWGDDIFPRAIYSRRTNGVIETDNEVLRDIVAVASDEFQVLALKADRTVIAFGSHYPASVLPAGLSNVVSIAVEGDSCWAIRGDGTVAQWGEDSDDSNIVAGLSNVTSIVWAGYRSYLALERDGTVLGFRLGPFGSPPEPTGGLAARPVRVRGELLREVAAVANMRYTPIILKTDGRVLSLGYQTPGAPPVEPKVIMLDDDTLAEVVGGESGKTPYSYTSADPVMIDGQALTNVLAIAGGVNRALALRADGTVVAWGRDDQDEAKVPPRLRDVTAIASNHGLSLALKSDGTILTWGSNYVGQTSVPAGLSNVTGIAAGGARGLAITTGNIPSSVYIYPHGRLEEMEREADLIFKGRAISTRAVSNTSFPAWGKTHATRFGPISVIKGHLDANELIFWHLTEGPNAWSGGAEPSAHQFEPGQCYLLFAARLDKPADLFAPPADATHRTNEFRQLYRDGVLRTLDDRPVRIPEVKQLHWFELGLLLGDTNATNQLYAIEELDRMSLPGRPNDRWSNCDDFKRRAVLRLLLPLVANTNQQIALRAIACFATASNPAINLTPFAATLERVANTSPFPSNRLAAIYALSGVADAAVSNSVAQLLKSPDENIRLGAVRLLPRFPREFAETALLESATDESENVRSAVADAIGEGKFDRALPTLAKLFAEPVVQVPLLDPTTMELPRSGEGWHAIGGVHGSAGFALMRFDSDQVADILKANLGDSGFHIAFVSKLAESNAEPWLAELVRILKVRLEYVEELSKAPGLDPRKYSDPRSDRVLFGAYAKCWEDIRQYLLHLPSEEFSSVELNNYFDLLETTIRRVQGMTVHEACDLYELYRTKGEDQRAAQIRRAYAGESWWFDDFDAHHPELKPIGHR